LKEFLEQHRKELKEFRVGLKDHFVIKNKEDKEQFSKVYDNLTKMIKATKGRGL